MLTQEQINDYKVKIQQVLDILPEIDKELDSCISSDTAQTLSFLLYDLNHFV